MIIPKISRSRFQPLRTLHEVLSLERPDLPSVALALFLQLHHLREHAAHSVHRSTGTVHYEGNPSARVDDTVHHGIGRRTRTTGCRARHGVLLRPEETVAGTGGPGADAYDPGTAGDRAGSQYGDLPRRYIRRERHR